jgi:CPA2 family monovalent cation:H+ antiporter-2
VIVATPDGYQARRAFEIARELNPGIDTVVRTHSEAELTHLEGRGVGLAVLAERELALAMMSYALRSLVLSEGQAHLYVQGSRGAGGDGTGRDRARLRSVPELRPHRTENSADLEQHLSPIAEEVPR